MKYIHLWAVELLQEKNISKTRICKDLDLQRGNFNRYCRDDFQKIDTNFDPQIMRLPELRYCGFTEDTGERVSLPCFSPSHPKIKQVHLYIFLFFVKSPVQILDRTTVRSIGKYRLVLPGFKAVP